MKRRRNRAGGSVARIGQLPYGNEDEALKEIELNTREFASELNQLEHAIGRPIVIGATMARSMMEYGSDEIVLTFDGESAMPTGWASPEPFIRGAMWLLDQLKKG